MFDDLHSDGLGDGRTRERPGQPARPLADREVPLGPPRTTIAEAVHAKRLDEDLAARRRLRTPAHLQSRIMNALPMHAPTLITPWWRREFVVTPSSALVVVTTLVAMAAAATALVFRLPH